MRLRHRVPSGDPPSAVLTPEYAAEVERMTAKAETAYNAAARRLEAAEAKAARARTIAERRHASRRDVERWQTAEALAELHREELAKYARIMAASPQSAAHRGRKSFRPTPPPGPVV